MFRGSVSLLAILAVGCASVDEELLSTQLPEPPAKWTAADDVADPPVGDWLAPFGDDALYGLVNEAMIHNNTLLIAAANLESARAGAKITRANLFPQLNAQGGASRNAIVSDPSLAAQAGGASVSGGTSAKELEQQFGVDADGDGKLDGLDLFVGAAGGTPGQDGIAESPLPNRRVYINNYSLGAQISWEIDLWGRLTDETRAAYKDAKASLADFEGTRLSIAGAVTQAWFSLIEARQQRELAERDVAARESNLRVTERRYERGVASSLDVRLSRSALGSSQANLAFRQRTEKESARRLEVLLGRYPAAELAAAEALPELAPLAGAGAPGDILARRPDLVAAEARMEANGLRARAARKALLPRLTLTSQIGTSGPDLSDLIDPERLAGNIAAGLFQPIFQGGRVRANAKRQRAVAEASLLTYAQTALQAYEEAENALDAETYLAASEAALKFAYEEAAAAEELTERRYSSGTATIFDLLNAQTRRISAESSYILAQRQRVSNRVALYLAIGGDFITDAPALAVTDAPALAAAETPKTE
ncbi:MAG: efflux transporter outer membrane subunit [Pseudomonadota bacterium]